MCPISHDTRRHHSRRRPDRRGARPPGVRPSQTAAPDAGDGLRVRQPGLAPFVVVRSGQEDNQGLIVPEVAAPLDLVVFIRPLGRTTLPLDPPGSLWNYSGCTSWCQEHLSNQIAQVFFRECLQTGWNLPLPVSTAMVGMPHILTFPSCSKRN